MRYLREEKPRKSLQIWTSSDNIHLTPPRQTTKPIYANEPWTKIGGIQRFSGLVLERNFLQRLEVRCRMYTYRLRDASDDFRLLQMGFRGELEHDFVTRGRWVFAKWRLVVTAHAVRLVVQRCKASWDTNAIGRPEDSRQAVKLNSQSTWSGRVETYQVKRNK